MNVLLCEPMSTEACMGYMIMALENLDYRDEQIWQVMAEFKELFDWVSIPEAEEHSRLGPY
jgi:hypothetical protein